MICLGCSDPAEEKSHLSFHYNGKRIELTSSEPATSPVALGNYLLTIADARTRPYPSYMDQFGITSLIFHNPHHLQDAPCFTINRIENNGFICGFALASNLADLCEKMPSYSAAGGGECVTEPLLFDPDNYDQKHVFSVITADFQYTPFGCITERVTDPYTGHIWQTFSCNNRGTFSLTGVNSFGDTLRITDGEFTSINIPQ